MKNYKVIFIIVNLILLLGYFNYSVYKKEEILKDGQTVLLKLAPVDPRSLMQGDYMRLNYEISQKYAYELRERRGYCIVKLDKNQVAESIRVQPDRTPLNPGEVLIAYTAPDLGQMKLGAESYFFQEGTGEKYEAAQYGALKIDESGNSLLVGLFDENLREIK